MVNWLQQRPNATEKEFIIELKKRYSDSEISKKFPKFLDDLEDWLKTIEK
jgi:hypothetical protein